MEDIRSFNLSLFDSFVFSLRGSDPRKRAGRFL